MKTSINMDTLQFTIWLCLLDCPPPDRSARTQSAVPNQLFIPFPYCHNRPSLCSLRQGCRGGRWRTSQASKHFSTGTKHWGPQSPRVPLFCPFLWLAFLPVLGGTVCYSARHHCLWNQTGLEPGLSCTHNPGKKVNFIHPSFPTYKIGVVIGPIPLTISLFWV